jgi:hypothetical protein
VTVDDGYGGIADVGAWDDGLADLGGTGGGGKAVEGFLRAVPVFDVFDVFDGDDRGVDVSILPGIHFQSE